MKCPICRRDTPLEYQEDHHLVPKCRKGNVTVTLCWSCADMLHKLFTIKELEHTYNTTETILSDERVQKWIKWVSKKPVESHICMKTKKRK